MFKNPSTSRLRPIAAAPEADAEMRLRRMTRRSFATGGVAALAGAGVWQWLRSSKPEDGVPWPLRRVLQLNERVAAAYFSPKRSAPTFDVSLAKDPRVNGRIGLVEKIDPAAWRLHVLGPIGQRVVERGLPIGAIHELPRVEMVTEFKCVEGWSQIVHWGGARLADFIKRYGHDTPFVGMATTDREYYVGLDRASALHSQSLLAYEMNGRPLSPEHGAPLRLVCPLKYGVKSIKQIGSIQFASRRPADFWAERGYDWYLGH